MFTLLISTLFTALLITVTTGFRIETNLTQGPLPGFGNWAVLKLDDHSDCEPNQPPSDWDNVSIPLPYLGDGIQLTAVSPNSNFRAIGKAFPAEITFYSVDLLQGLLRFSVAWRGPPWTLFIGFSPV